MAVEPGTVVSAVGATRGEAFGHLRLAVAEMPDPAGAGRVDDDLAPLRDDPRSEEVLGAGPA